MVETLPAFGAVILAAGQIAPETAFVGIAFWAQLFFVARLGHAAVYILGVPYLRTPVYLVSWAAILMIGVYAFHSKDIGGDEVTSLYNPEN